MDNNPQETVLVPPVKKKAKFYWPTRILLLLITLSILAAFIVELVPVAIDCAQWLVRAVLFGSLHFSENLFDLVHPTQALPLSLPSVLGSPLPLLLLWSLLFLVFAGKIKRNPRYSRWMGIALLMFAGQLAFSKLPNILYCFVYNYPFVLTNYLPTTDTIVLMIFCLFLAIIFFTGAKKKLWVFLAALIGILLWFGTTGIDIAIYMITIAPRLLRILNQLFRYLVQFFGRDITSGVMNILYAVDQLFMPIPVVADFFGTTCFWVGLLALMLPAKKAAS